MNNAEFTQKNLVSASNAKPSHPNNAKISFVSFETLSGIISACVIIVIGTCPARSSVLLSVFNKFKNLRSKSYYG